MKKHASSVPSPAPVGELNGHLARRERLARLVHAIENPRKGRVDELRKRLPVGLPHEVEAIDQRAAIERVGQLEDVLGPAKERGGHGGFGEQVVALDRRGFSRAVHLDATEGEPEVFGELEQVVAVCRVEGKTGAETEDEKARGATVLPVFERRDERRPCGLGPRPPGQRKPEGALVEIEERAVSRGRQLRAAERVDGHALDVAESHGPPEPEGASQLVDEVDEGEGRRRSSSRRRALGQP